MGHLETADFPDHRLLDRAANLGKYIVGIRPDEANRPYYDYQNNRQHDRILRDILAALIVPELLKTLCHEAPFTLLALAMPVYRS